MQCQICDSPEAPRAECEKPFDADSRDLSSQRLSPRQHQQEKTNRAILVDERLQHPVSRLAGISHIPCPKSKKHAKFRGPSE